VTNIDSRASGKAEKQELVRRLWALCGVLRDDGVTYHEYLGELTPPLVLKLADELSLDKKLPHKLRWSALTAHPKAGMLAGYQAALEQLGATRDRRIASIFRGSATRLRTDSAVSRLIKSIDAFEWSSLTAQEIGDVYEGLIQKSAQEARYGAGQYFTPRNLIDAIVAVVKPAPGESVYDPAAGTAGFLVSAGLHARRSSDELDSALFGVELSRDVYRLGMANLVIHKLHADFALGDSLAADNSRRRPFDVCLTNPPFGVKGSISADDSAAMEFPTANKQLAFVQHVYSSLQPHGRGAIIVPDNVLFESGVAESVRERLVETHGLHTVLMLPPGIFYATGVRTSVLFFSAHSPRRSRVWRYDLRTAFDKRAGLGSSELDRFVSAYGSNPDGSSRRRRTDMFSWVSTDRIAENGYRLDVSPPGPSTSRSGQTYRLDLIERELQAVAEALVALRRITSPQD
jgi:type I restriction enzyme M protein